MYTENLNFPSKAYIVLNLCELWTPINIFVGDVVQVHLIQDVPRLWKYKHALLIICGIFYAVTDVQYFCDGCTSLNTTHCSLLKGSIKV